MVRIAPSLLSADFSRLAEEVADVQQAGAELLHLDIMDGHFVPNLTFGPLLVRALTRTNSRLPVMDAHLMVSDPDSLIGDLAAAGVGRVAVHVEACVHLHRSLQLISSSGMQPGVAINPATPLGPVAEVLSWVDFVVLMAVNPGFGGQRLIPECVDKVSRLRALTGACAGGARGIDITVDGGVDKTNAASLAAAGATTLVAGTAVFGADNRAAAIAELRRAASGGKQT